ncbi:GDP-mannose 4,6-dehydratase [Shewanella dokdonensis]|uniref:GDP-mannose 4,6-dehydratase n=1 Tax=Shewanella dokdonensis TaxID=712036 RepID=A0ABX8DG05_9GAMM|nr:GDP-mannose 4,6-dehydratase [Shewanella dokdonensis]MCL1073885.1 GDP-mannose 4,6-dehydratase [Shewanella dokdonensis]QVK23666.1 GDP-mannose 4,6-dehydratase [Shewanella dokdonensis]
MKYLITGGCGFLGTNIAAQLLVNGEDITIFDNLYRHGSYQNLEWLRTIGKFDFIHADIRNSNDVEKVIKRLKPDVIYHLAGQVAMTTSIVDPRMDFEVNAIGSFNLLNSVRLFSPYSSIIYSSTNKVYGDLEQFNYRETSTRYECIEKPNGFDESISLDFHSPYGVSKGCADQYMLDFHRIYGLNTVVFRHSSMFGGRQFATYDQGWVGWFLQKAIEIKNGMCREPLTISGNGKQVRDLLYSSDCVSLYLNASKKIEKLTGKAFNIGGGIKNSLSIIELFNFFENFFETDIHYKQLAPRKSDQKIFIADCSRIEKIMDWHPKIIWNVGVENVYDWYISTIK